MDIQPRFAETRQFAAGVNNLAIVLMRKVALTTNVGTPQTKVCKIYVEENDVLKISTIDNISFSEAK